LDLPFPQNKDLTIRHSSSSGVGKNRTSHVEHFYASSIPVQPLSSNRYYVIQTHGRHALYIELMSYVKRPLLFLSSSNKFESWQSMKMYIISINTVKYYAIYQSKVEITSVSQLN